MVGDRYFRPVAASGRVRNLGTRDRRRTWGRGRCDCLLEQPVEELALRPRIPAVESEGELVQVVIEVLVSDRALVRA